MINLTNSEKRAVIILTSVILLSVLIQWILPHETRPDIYDYSYEDSLFRMASNGAFKKNIIDLAEIQKTPVKTYPKTKSKKLSALKPKSININSATYEELIRLPRIGKVTATSILDYRNANGPFKTLQDLTDVKRIGPKTLEKISPFIYIITDTAKVKKSGFTKKEK